MLTVKNHLLFRLKAEQKSLWLISFLIIFAFLNNTLKASAQITPDGTLPSNSIVIPNTSGDLITITGGTNAGNNLFHSFQEFSVLNGQTAFFDNGLTIENIFSRVTGSSISNIEGIINANGTANLFLINPNGIIFGPNATLNIGGSFVGSTADSIQFSDGSLYSAVDPQAPSLLTINIPIGLQYGAEPGNITVQGNGNNTGFRDPSVGDYSLVKDFRPTGLQVPEGETLALIGGNIALDGGNLTAVAGYIELGSVKEGVVKFDASNGIKTFDYQEVTGFQDIALVNAASVEVSGNSSGKVNVQGQNISLADASAILSNTSGDGTAGSISLNTTESVQVTGISQTQIPFVSYVSTGTAPGSTGKGADLTINTSYLLVAGGAQVDSPVFGSGDGGTLSVNAGRVELIGGSPLAGPSGLFTPVVPGSSGDGGDINIAADSVLAAGGAQAYSISGSTGQAGDFNISAENIELNGTSPGGFPSGLFANAFANGNGGNLNLETDSLVLTNGADLGSTVFGTGKAGNINIKANTIELSDPDSLDDPSSISVSVQSEAQKVTEDQDFTGGEDITLDGIGGDITIEANSVSLSDGTQITSNVLSNGDAGNITITASEIDLKGYSTIADSSNGRPSGLFTTVIPGATGNSGNMTITTDNLRVSEGAQIAISTAGSGSAGKLTLNVSDSVELTGNAIAEGGGSSGLFSSAVFADGNGGNIDLTTNQLIIKDGATINASNFLTRNAAEIPPGTGVAGNIKIDAQRVELNGADAGTPASINAATFAAGGGDIVLQSNNVTVTNGAQVTATTQGAGDGGSITISANELNLNNQAQISANSTGLGQAGDIAIASDSLRVDQGNITATASAAGDAGTISVTSNLLKISNQGNITTSTTGAGHAGNVTVNVDSDLALTNDGRITSETTGDGNGGNIGLTAGTLALNSGGALSTNTAASGDAGNINLTVKTANFSDSETGIFSEVEETATGNGGNIALSTQEFNLNNQAQVSVNSTGLGQAGNIAISSDSLNLDQGEITATSKQTGGGDISLTTDSLLLDNNSTISTSVTDSTGGGGNILIDNNGFIIGKNDSHIKADAVFGPGGNIQINAQGIFFDLDSTITASSKFGTDGVVEINLTESEQKLGTVQLPNRLSVSEAVIVSSCPIPESNTFTVTGSGGLPENPSSYLRGRTVWQDTRRLASDYTNSANIKSESTSVNSAPTAKNSPTDSIVESQGWIINERGNLELVAVNPRNIAPTVRQQKINCGNL